MNHAIAAIIAANIPLTPARYAESPFSLAFEQSERELGERLGYPALVYEQTPKQCDGYPQLTGCPNTATTNVLGAWDFCDTCATRYRVQQGCAQQIARLRADLDDAHQHVGALLKWSPLPQYAINEGHADAITTARAWLRRRGGETHG